MQMNVLASTVLFLLIGPFDFVSSWEVESTDSGSVLQVLSPAHVFISVSDVLELNCSIRRPSHGLRPSQLLWRHNDTWVHNSSSVIDNSTVQLKFHTHYKDAGVYRCEVFYNSSSFKRATSKNITVIVGEKPKLGRCPVSIANVYGKPVQTLTLQWTALQINVTNSLVVGKIQNFNCVTQDRTFCSQTPRIRNESLSCYLGKDVLRELFQWSELLGTCADDSNWTRCDVICAKLKVENKFGATESDMCYWVLQKKVSCPPPRNMSVTLGKRSITVSWLRPLLVWANYSVYYRLAYNGTQLLMGKSLPTYRPLRRHFDELSYTITGIEPFTRYTITLACTLTGLINTESGPAISTEVMSREEVPSEAPICEVVNRSIDGDAFVLLKPPPKYSWNGIPKKYVVYYNSGDQQRGIQNVSLDGLNATEPSVVRITNIDADKDYSVTGTMCTVAGCGQSSDLSCFIPIIHTNESIETVPQTPAHSTTGTTWVAIISVTGVTAGIVVSILVICLIKRRRSQKKQRPSLETLFTGMNDFRHYENDADDGPSLCDESQVYDTIPRALLLKNVGCSVGSCPVSEI